MPISYKIERRNSEIVRDRIAALLASEFNSQLVYYYNTDCDNVDFYVERSIPIADTELTVVNVSIDGGEYGNKNYGNIDGDIIYNIDVYCNSKNKGADSGDKLAAFKSQRIIGIIWGILEYPAYKTLSFNPGFIGSTMCKGFKQLVINKAGNDDALNTVVNRLQFQVKLVEGVQLPEAIPLLGNETSIYLGLTEKGYRISFLTEGPPPPRDPRYVIIVDQYDNVLARLEGGSLYEVNVIKNIVDDIFNNQITITDNILPE